MDRAVRDALEGGFYNKGEACTAASRILVDKRVAEAFTNRLSEGVRALKVGAGNDPTTHVGPVVSKAQQERVLKYIEIAKQEGARTVAEGRLPTDPALAGGFYVAPTLLADVAPRARAAQEEIFGPVVTVTVFDTEEEAVEITNSSDYGLFAAIYSRDSERCLRSARQIEVGVVLVNNYFRGILGSPFGGTKHSGYGREHTIETLSHFGYRKLIRLPSGTGELAALASNRGRLWSRGAMNMRAYSVTEVEVIDVEEYAKYRELAGAAVAKYGGRFLVRGAAPIVAEGEWPAQRRLVVIEFPSLAQLKRWYDSPEYAPARAIAITALRRRLLFAEGVEGAG